MSERVKQILWCADLSTEDPRSVALLRLVLALASYEHQVSVVFYGAGLSLLSVPAETELSGMIAAFKLYAIKAYAVTDSALPPTHAQMIVLSPECWQPCLIALNHYWAGGSVSPLPALPMFDTAIDWIL